MTYCLNERTLFLLSEGDGRPRERQHLAACAACQGRQRALLRTAHEQLNAKLFQAGPLKPEDLAPYLDTVTKLKQQVMQEGIKVALDLRGVLTTDQLAKAAEIHDRLQALHAEMKQLLGDPPAMPMTP